MKSVISPEYAALNRRLHAEAGGYGAQGGQDAKIVVDNCRQNGYRTVLDYGCGKGTLKVAVETMAPELKVLEFDPAVEGKTELPTEPIDFLAALDVMEHVEPDYLDAVLDTFRDLRPKIVLLKISLTPSKRSLPDGRNAHILVRPAKWWMKRLEKRFAKVASQTFPLHLIFFGTPK